MIPKVSIIVPCYNEERTIGMLLQAIHSQDFPVEDLEVLIADGRSTDKTREVVMAFQRNHPALNITVIDNPSRIIPAALNLAIAASKGEFIIRLDAHSVPERDYVARCIQALERTGAANVGGIWIIRPSKNTWLARSIAAAAGHPLGAGGARYRIRGHEGEVETVPFGAFQREWVERVGGFNEDLITNEDYEYNVRLRQAGGSIWFDPAIRSIYFARSSLPALARQYTRYGYWKARMLRRFPGSIRWRQALPPFFVLSLLGLAAFGFFWKPAHYLLGLQLGIYALITMFSGIHQAITKRDLGLLIGFPLSLWTMHFFWGGAFLWSLFYSVIRRAS